MSGGTLAVIGTGSMGSAHVRAAVAVRRWDKVLVIDTDAERARRVAESVDMPWSNDPSDAATGCDAAVVAVPTRGHESVAAPLLRAGVPLLIEKPLAPDLAGARRLAELAAAGSVPVLVGHIERFNPAIAELRRFRDELVHLEMRRVGAYTNRVDVGVTADLMIHDLDLFLDITQREVATVRAVMRSGRRDDQPAHHQAGLPRVPLPRARTDDLATALLVSAGGVTGTLTASRLGQTKHRSIIATTRTVQVVADLVAQSVRIYRIDHAEYVDDDGPRYRQRGVMEIPFLEHGEPLAHEHRHFADVAQGLAAPLVGPRDALAALDLVRRVEDAAGPVL